MPKNKFKNTTHSPKTILMNSYGLDATATDVLIRELHKENITFSYENNIFYGTNNSTNIKLEVSNYPYVLSKINELKKFIEMKTDNNLLLYYLYEKINHLEDKIRDLERDNEDVHEKLANYAVYHD